MRSVEHLAVSVPVAIVTVYLLAWPAGPTRIAALLIAGIASGVLVDLDHFPISRWKRGDWQHLRTALRNPAGTMTAHEEALEGIDRAVPAETRLATHAVLTAVFGALLYRFDPILSGVVVVLLAVHIGCDVKRSYL